MNRINLGPIPLASLAWLIALVEFMICSGLSWKYHTIHLCYINLEIGITLVVQCFFAGLRLDATAK